VKTFFLILAFFLARRVLQGFVVWIATIFVIVWVARHDPLIGRDLKNLIQEFLNGW
jgi:type IV secretory pathway TrbD component